MTHQKSNPTKTSLTATTTALSHDGRGIAAINGKITFIEGALANEEVTFTITRTHSKYNEGKITEVIRPSPDRITPLCSYFEKCGGCHLQHLSANAQLQHKENLLLQQLKHLAHIAPKEVLPPLHGKSWGYRRKARLGIAFDSKKNCIHVGFREKNSRYLTNIDSCETLDPSVGKKIPELKSLLLSLESRSQIPQLEIAITDQTQALVVRHMSPLTNNDKEKLIAFAKAHDFRIYLQAKGPESLHLLWPENITDTLLTYSLVDYQLQYKFRPTDFIQINSEINNRMLKQALNLIDSQSEDHILDLFCGLGNFTLPLAQKAKRVLGIEGDVTMVEQAKNNAHLNKINNAFFLARDLNQEDSLTTISDDYHKILLDPPRNGALNTIKQFRKFKKVRTILYISCNPATLARDASELIHQGYHLKKAGILDMFPQTYHVESIALFEKN